MDKTHNNARLAAGPAGLPAGGVQRDHPADDRGQLLVPGHPRPAPTGSGSAPTGSTQVLGDERSARRAAAPAGLQPDRAGDRDPARASRWRWRCRPAAWPPRPRLVLMALPLLIPWNVVGTIWQIFARGRHRPGRLADQQPGHRLQLHRRPAGRLDHHRGHGRLALDAAGGAALLRRAARDPARLLPGGRDRRRLALGGVPLHRAAQDARRAADRGPAAVHGQLHDLHRAVRRHRRRPGQRHDLPRRSIWPRSRSASSTSGRRRRSRSSTS